MEVKSTQLKKLLFLTVSTLFLFNCNHVNNQFLLEGKISKIESSVVFLKPAFDGSYYLYNKVIDASTVTDGKFKFKLTKTDIPQPYYLEIDGVATNKFMLGLNDLSIELDSTYPRVTPKINGLNSSFIEDINLYRHEKKKLIKWFDKSYDSVKSLALNLPHHELAMMQLRENMTKKSNRQLLHFVQNHPDSYYAFWELVSALQWNDYFPEYEKTFNSFSEKIRDSYAAKIFQKKLAEAKLRAVGGDFPIVSVKDSLLTAVKLDVKHLPNSYTLIDFWFSACQPCISQFPEYINLYNTYQNQGFEIIGISTDREKDVELWKKMTVKHQLSWPNFLDDNFDAAKRMNITKYPTNFLIDKRGKIIAKDLSTKELRDYLEKKRVH